MLTTVILSFVVLLFFTVVPVNYRGQTRYKNGMLFAVTLPPHAMEDEQLKDVQAEFGKRFKRMLWWMAAALVPVLLLYNWIGYQVIYLILWALGFNAAANIWFRQGFRATLALKRENEWFVGEKRVIQSDLRAAYLKNQRSAPLGLFAIPLAMAAGLVWWGMHEQELLVIGIGSLIVTLLILLLTIGMRRMKAKVYSSSSEVNVGLNQARRRYLSYLWLALAILGNIHFLLISLFLVSGSESVFSIWLGIIFVFGLVPATLVLYVYYKIAHLEQETLELDSKTVYTDDDEYWSNGITYHNPDDKTVFVPKRVGIGTTVNTATTAGKWFIWGTVPLVAVIVIGVSFLLISSELNTPVLTVTPERKVEINYPMYSFDFNVDDIEQISLVDNIPSGVKTNGEGTSKVARGHFKLKELGKARMYIFKSPPYIQIQLKDSYVFYNEQEPEQTKRVFEQLRKEVEG
ncbi:DUF5808 domain-containing protein [Paenibacillus pinihumi]|uniref:DUF5808 domain-containing protein n=1 Tax=Paenibacillus pinihumi TaxID=669462 RepID=UPI00042639DF|nr:DUF5808 domain-containing protein [Paenibacillus pinihumi]